MCANTFQNQNVSVGGCEPNPCENGGLCLEKDERPFCVCKMGFEGDNCTKGMQQLKDKYMICGKALWKQNYVFRK